LRCVDPPYADPNDAYALRCSCDPQPNGNGGQTVVDHTRLFPIREDVRWTYRVHEQILPALRRANIPVKWTDVTSPLEELHRVRVKGHCRGLVYHHGVACRVNALVPVTELPRIGRGEQIGGILAMPW
jgi:hypothetical protein